ncbi:MAG: SulP family inorganic anion transporter [Hyphomicrobiales bacterium]|nr:SulP family inorganic anion transporter [Hyphomicrobiales bacterium]
MLEKFIQFTGATEPLTIGKIKTEILSGLTVALALVPEAVAFAIVATVDPLVGLYAAFIVGLITAIFGGRPGMISGATGALAVVMVSLVVGYGVEYLFATVVLMGIFQLLAGVFHLGKFIRMVPHPVMLGFVNGLAIVIFLAQLNQFKVNPSDSGSAWLSGNALYIMLGLVGLTMLIMVVLPKFTKAIPAPLVAILVVSLLVVFGGINASTVGDVASVAGGLPQFHLPMVPFTFETLIIILPYAFILSAIGLIESLLTLNLVNDMLGGRGGASKECVAQGASNLVTGLFGGMGGCAMIGQSMINVKSGGTTRISGIAAAMFLLIIILFASGLIEQIPLAALVGVMFMVVIGTFAWNSLKTIRTMKLSDAMVLVLVTFVTVWQDLAIAVVVGVIVSALVFAWEAAKRMGAKVHSEDGSLVYKLKGVLFFGSVESFNELFNIEDVHDDVVIDFIDSRVRDHSGIEAIEALAAKYHLAGKTLHLRHLSSDCRNLLNKSARQMVEVSKVEDPNYKVAADYKGHFPDGVSQGSAH